MMPAPTSDFVVTILGSGTCVPSLARSSCAVLMEGGTDKLLFDTGPGTMHRLLAAGVTIYDVTVVCYSHFHPDHTGELVPFLFATKYAGGDRGGRPLTLAGGPGFLDFFRGLKAVYGSWITFDDDELVLVEIQPGADRLDTSHFSIVSAPTSHRDESVAYRVATASGRAAVYSGDTDYSDSLIQLARRADLLVCECSHPDESKVAGHSTPAVAGEMATRAAVGKLVLTHFYPACDQVDIANQCRRAYNGPLFLAEDLMRFDLSVRTERTA